MELPLHYSFYITVSKVHCLLICCARGNGALQPMPQRCAVPLHFYFLVSGRPSSARARRFLESTPMSASLISLLRNKSGSTVAVACRRKCRNDVIAVPYHPPQSISVYSRRHPWKQQPRHSMSALRTWACSCWGGAAYRMPSSGCLAIRWPCHSLCNVAAIVWPMLH
jgi:hypothetical protein